VARTDLADQVGDVTLKKMPTIVAPQFTLFNPQIVQSSPRGPTEPIAPSPTNDHPSPSDTRAESMRIAQHTSLFRAYADEFKLDSTGLPRV
jgi:hypothetical protein